MVLFIEALSDFSRQAVISNIVGKLVYTNIASVIPIILQLEQIFLAAGGQQPAHSSCALVSGFTMVFWPRHSLVMPPFREVGGHLVATDDVQLGACCNEI